MSSYSNEEPDTPRRATSVAPDPLAEGLGTTGSEQTGLKALVAVARHLGLDWSLPRILHLHGQNREPDAEQLARTARVEGLKAVVHRVDWDRLQRFHKLTPLLARLNDGGYVVVLQTGVEPPPGAVAASGFHVVLFNPRLPEANLYPM